MVERDDDRLAVRSIRGCFRDRGDLEDDWSEWDVALMRKKTYVNVDGR